MFSYYLNLWAFFIKSVLYITVVVVAFAAVSGFCVFTRMQGGSGYHTLIRLVYSYRTWGIIRMLSVLHSYPVVLIVNE